MHQYKKNKLKITEPVQKESRPSWQDVPKNIVADIEKILQAKIIKGETAWGGFSNTACFIIELETGIKVFIKGTHPNQDAHGTKMVEQEIKAYHKIPYIENFAPKYLGHVSDKNEDGWSLIIFEYIENKNIQNFDLDIIKNIFSQLKNIHHSNKIENISHAKNTNYIERHFQEQGGWLRIYNEEKIYNKFIKLFKDKNYAEDFFNKALPLFCNAHKNFIELKTVEGILHQDLRIDNILLTNENKILIIDWTNFCYGAVVLDLAVLLPSLSYNSDYKIYELLEIYNQQTNLNIDEEDLTKAIANMSGFIADAAYRGIPEKLPRLRWMQKTILLESLHYLAKKFDLGTVPDFIDSL